MQIEKKYYEAMRMMHLNYEMLKISNEEVAAIFLDEIYTLSTKFKDAYLKSADGNLSPFKGNVRTEKDLHELMKIVCSYFEIPPSDCFNKIRKQKLVLARYTVFWYLKEFWFVRNIDIARLFKYNHTTISHAITTINERLEVDKKFQRDISSLIKLIDNSNIDSFPNLKNALTIF